MPLSRSFSMSYKHANIALFVPHAGCKHMCSFCNQKTISGKSSVLTPDDVSKTLEKAALDPTTPENTEIAFFGGSFTAIDRDYMVSLLERTVPYIKNGRFKGIRASTRPDAVDEEVLEILKSYGVTSLELGAQSMVDEVLAANMRGHTAEDVYKASELIKKSGISLGLQMMTGLYRDCNLGAVKTAKSFIEIHPDTVRIYPTIVLEGTYLGELYKKGAYCVQNTEDAVKLCAILLKMFHKANIKVIRLGLHSGGGVEEGYLAGPYHPAFGELCESEIYLNEAKKALDAFFKNKKNGASRENSREATIYVNEHEISKMIGQKRRNTKALEALGYSVKVKGDSTVPIYKTIIR